MKDMGEPRIKIGAMPSDTNPAGNIFGGWILSQIDLAGAIAARELAQIRVVTISMKEVIFKEPVFIGDIVSCYAKITHVGSTSITTEVKVVVQRLNAQGFCECVPVTTAEVTYVSVDEKGEKKPRYSEWIRRHGFR